METKGVQFLQKPLYVFDLPEDILVTLVLRNQPDEDTSSSSPPPSRRSPRSVDAQDGAPSDATSCGLCSLTFPNVQEQRGHVRSDLHGYNLKQKMKGLKLVSETEFERLVGDLDESISGSESSESDADEEDEIGSGVKSNETTLSALLKRQARISVPDGDGSGTKNKQRGSGSPPLYWFKSSALPKEISLGVYRAVFTNAEQEESHLTDTIRKKQLPPTQQKRPVPEGRSSLHPKSTPSPHYFLCMIGGGHFAAMVVALAPKYSWKNAGMDERQATVLAHKTFHRYTTRRKQGGSQSTSDAAKGAAHSAGSILRRYNEAALTNEVRELLSEWKSMIDSAELRFIRAAGSTNRRILFGPYEGQVLRHNDPRNRGFPFSTRRATQAELMRSFVELTRIKVSRVDEAALAAAAAAESARTAPATPRSSTPSKPPKPVQSKEDEVAQLHTTQLAALIRRSKAPAVISYLKSNSLSPSFQFYPPGTQQNYHTPTPLHLAASLSSPAVVLALLTKADADPGVRNAEGKTAFEIAGDRATRGAFRIARHELGEQKWAWDAAGVPSPLKKSDVDEQNERERKEEERKEQERRKSELDRMQRESEAVERNKKEKKFGKGKATGALPGKTAAEIREEEARGLTPQMRMQLERERRARAAEERIRRMQGN